MSKPRDLPPFDALPARAKRDPRFRGAHYRLLLAIAAHDRFSHHNGSQACWASIRSLAEDIHLHRVTVERGINDLIKWGYLTSERKNQNTRFLAIIYADPQVSVHRLPPDPPTRPKGGVRTDCHGVSPQTETVSVLQNAKSKPRKAESAPNRTFLQRLPTNSVETARPPQKEAARSPIQLRRKIKISDQEELPPEGIIVARMQGIEKWLKPKRISHYWSRSDLKAVRTYHAFVDAVFEAYPAHESVTGGMACRLVSELSGILKDNGMDPTP